MESTMQCWIILGKSKELYDLPNIRSLLSRTCLVNFAAEFIAVLIGLSAAVAAAAAADVWLDRDSKSICVFFCCCHSFDISDMISSIFFSTFKSSKAPFFIASSFCDKSRSRCLMSACSLVRLDVADVSSRASDWGLWAGVSSVELTTLREEYGWNNFMFCSTKNGCDLLAYRFCVLHDIEKHKWLAFKLGQKYAEIYRSNGQ